MKNSLVSIVIPTFNSEKTIELCLKSVNAQTYKNTEIIVVDNYSHDHTIQISKKYTKKIFACSGERSEQRNFGFKKAKGEFFLYLDSDMVLSRSIIKEAVSMFNKNRQIAGIYIPEVVEGNTFLVKILNFERSFYNETSIDAVRIVKAEIFKKIKGFDENLIAGEDWDLDRRVRACGNMSSVSSPLYHLQYGLTLVKYLYKKNYYTKYISRYINKWDKNDEVVKKQLEFKYRYFNVFIENQKWKKLIRNPVYAFLMYLLKFVVGYIYIRFHN